MIVLKHLSNEFDIDPHKLRKWLRNNFGNRKGTNWTWPSEDDVELQKIKSLIKAQILEHGSIMLNLQTKSPVPSPRQVETK